MGIASHDVLWDLGPGIQVVAVEVAKFKACYQQTAQTLVKVCLLNLSTTHGFGQVLVF